MNYTKKQVEESRRYLKDVIALKEGETVYTIVRHVSASGMMRHISCFVIRDGEPVNISTSVATVIGWSVAKGNDGIKVSGCGMDMGFHVVNTLSYIMFKPEGNGHAAGYELKQRWM
ncbi:MAG: hypothetical protein PHC68_02690 [Syntrophorhabdaceae bacterium]|nr:hypothetical protein [Syntrophorhabdaceae bacterium]